MLKLLTSGLILCGIIVAFAVNGHAADKVDVRISLPDASSESAEVAEGGVLEVRKSIAVNLQLASELPSGLWHLEFDAFCLGQVPEVSVRDAEGPDTAQRIDLPSINHSEAFVSYQASLGRKLTGAKNLELNLRLAPETNLQLRSIRLTRGNPAHTHPPSARSTTAPTSDISEYLNTDFAGRISSITATHNEITVAGSVPASIGEPQLVAVPMWQLLTATLSEDKATPVKLQPDGRFRMTVPRFASSGEDRLLCRWVLATRRDGGLKAMSHGRYAEHVPCQRSQLPAATVNSKKGLGGWHLPKSEETKDDLTALGIAAVTININAMHDLASPNSKPGWEPFTWQGRTYYANPRRLAAIDRTLLEAQRHSVMVSVILLVSNPRGKGSIESRLLANPEADPSGIFAMPNVTSEKGLQFYGAILKLMAERWTRPDARYGRIHHWIMHNEVDFGWVWTNAGRKSDVEYMSLYHRSMRITDLIVRQFDPNAKVWISLTHHWANKGNDNGYGSRRMLELLVEYSQAEGNFPWAVAYHPYPQNLRAPRTWEDHQATFTFDTDKITPRNLEVLDAWMRRPEMKFGDEVRPVHLSENGFNSPDYSTESLNEQAAGMAFAWKKMQNLSSIKMWQYHNWIDNRHEGGLRIGLRKFPDDQQQPYGEKPIWYVYQSLGTDSEEATLQPYLETIGISSWDEVIHHDPIQ